MTTTIETVKVEDIYPLEDEYGNDMATRDYSLEVNKEYVRELADSFGPGGTPDELITLVRDKGIYRVKAGNSRVRAMELLGTKECQAIVEDIDGEEDRAKAIVETVVRTNTKKKYEALEESSFVRQLHMFGDDQYVSEVSGIEVEKVARVRKAVEIVDDAADDMSLLRLIAIGEFSDDEDAVEALTNCEEGSFQRVYDSLVRMREEKRKCEEIEAALSEAEIELVEGRPDGYAYDSWFDEVGDVANLAADAKVTRNSYGCYYNVYLPVDDSEEVDPEEEARNEAIAMRRARYEKASESRAAFVAGHVFDDMHELVEEADESPYSWDVDHFAKKHGIELPVGPAHVIAAYVTLEGEPWSWRKEYDEEDNMRQFVDLTDCLKSHGYEPPQEEADLYDEVTAALEAMESAKDGEADE